jgi:hypothetical protein
MDASILQFCVERSYSVWRFLAWGLLVGISSTATADIVTAAAIDTPPCDPLVVPIIVDVHYSRLN